MGKFFHFYLSEIFELSHKICFSLIFLCYLENKKYSYTFSKKILLFFFFLENIQVPPNMFFYGSWKLFSSYYFTSFSGDLCASFTNESNLLAHAHAKRERERESTMKESRNTSARAAYKLPRGFVTTTTLHEIPERTQILRYISANFTTNIQLNKFVEHFVQSYSSRNDEKQNLFQFFKHFFIIFLINFIFIEFYFYLVFFVFPSRWYFFEKNCHVDVQRKILVCMMFCFYIFFCKCSFQDSRKWLKHFGSGTKKDFFNYFVTMQTLSLLLFFDFRRFFMESPIQTYVGYCRCWVRAANDQQHDQNTYYMA